jgi:hypothetical protein
MDEEARSLASAANERTHPVVSGSSERPEKRPKAEPVTTLSGFFRRKRYTPKRFLSDLTDANIWSFSEDDRETALNISDELDPKFGRTVGLATAALRAPDDRFRRPLLDFLWRSAERRIHDRRRFLQVELPQPSDA